MYNDNIHPQRKHLLAADVCVLHSDASADSSDGENQMQIRTLEHQKSASHVAQLDVFRVPAEAYTNWYVPDTSVHLYSRAETNTRTPRHGSDSLELAGLAAVGVSVGRPAEASSIDRGQSAVVQNM